MQQTAQAIAEAPSHTERLRGRVTLSMKPHRKHARMKGGYIIISTDDGEKWWAHMRDLIRCTSEPLFREFGAGTCVAFTPRLRTSKGPLPEAVKVRVMRDCSTY